jgi:hypothetical protein
VKQVYHHIASPNGSLNPGGNAHGDRGNGLNRDSFALARIPIFVSALFVTGASP